MCIDISCHQVKSKGYLSLTWEQVLFLPMGNVSQCISGQKNLNKVIRFNYLTFVSALFLIFLHLSSIRSCHQPVKTPINSMLSQMRSSAVMWHIRELFSNSGSGEEEEGGGDAATGAIFTLQFMTSRRQRVCWAEKAAASPFGSSMNVWRWSWLALWAPAQIPLTSAVMTENPWLVLFGNKNVHCVRRS